MSIKGDWRAFPDPSKKNEPRNETRINAYEISYIVIIHFGKSPSFKSRDTVISPFDYPHFKSQLSFDNNYLLIFLLKNPLNTTIPFINTAMKFLWPF